MRRIFSAISAPAQRALRQVFSFLMATRKLSTSTKELQGKSAVITGGNRGIGLAVAQALAAEGCNILIGGRDKAKLKAASKQITGNTRVVAQPCDVRDQKSVEQLFAVAKREFKTLDILINNAGIAHPLITADKLSLEQWNDVIATNLTGLFLCTRAALPLMRKGGAIVNNLSIAAQTVFVGMSAYDASKHGALGFTNTIREELRERKIRVIALIPGATDTEIWKQFMPDAERGSMMTAASVASVVLNALIVPESMGVEELRLLPIVGTSRH
jgi:NAD(P)-dependent dehydrogenase (short-subunit alcohol dehydrogenase family)